jgi:drug/metabolite transporter (DMT)-like permease
VGWRIWLLLLVAQAVWAGSYVAMKLAGDAMPVGSVVLFRYGIATLGYLFLLPIVGLPRFERRDWLLVIALGAVNFALTPTLQVMSLQYTRAADVSILIGLEPVITVVLAAFFLREHLDRRLIGAMLLGLGGVWVLSDVSAAADVATRNRLWGNLLFLGSILCEAAVTVSGGRLARLYSPLGTVAAMKAVGFLTACVFYGPAVLATDLTVYDGRTWGALIYLGLLSSLFAYGVWYAVLGKIRVNQAAPSLFVQPVIGAALGWLILDEHLGVRTWIGGTLILGSLAWGQFISRRPAEVAE